jgi:hypothetical protein
MSLILHMLIQRQLAYGLNLSNYFGTVNRFSNSSICKLTGTALQLFPRATALRYINRADDIYPTEVPS